ncbi:hypothetical protein ACGF7W_39340 [Streptomyces sp. NPDC048219]|uniref:hypothetical protein n=1 Tax=Streptomyces sp. NPDC048219 TaxID=3365517 RepID=UPI00371A5D33
MGISTGEQPGYALLVAAEAPVRHPFAVNGLLPQLAAVPPAQLVGTSYASAVQLANPDDPNTVLTTLRTAAAVEGPLLVYVAGQLVVDHRQHLLHLALARTTARTVRYTALPWHWIGAELHRRPPGTTTVLADLAADTDVWQALVHQEQTLAGPFALYGTVQLQDRRHRPSPAYTHALAHILRTAPTRPNPEQLHHQAVRASAVDPAATLLLGGQPPVDQAPQTDVNVPAPRTEPAPTTTAAADEDDPHRAISEASRAGRHGEAAAIAASYEQAALREHGAQSVEVAHWIEVRAFLALQEGAPDRACQLWLQAAVIRLTADQPEHHPEVAEAVDRAHGAWHLVSDPVRVRQLGTELLSLRTRVPGKSGARADVQRRLANLSRALQP